MQITISSKMGMILLFLPLVSLGAIVGCGSTSPSSNFPRENLSKNNTKQISKDLDSIQNICSSLDILHAKQKSNKLLNIPIKLSISIDSEQDLNILLSNDGDREVQIVRPRLNYSFDLHFYDVNGKEIRPNNIRIINQVNSGAAGIIHLKPGQSATESMMRKSYLGNYESLKDCALMAIEYKGSGYPLKYLSDKMKSEVLVGPLWSNTIALQ